MTGWETPVITKTHRARIQCQHDLMRQMSRPLQSETTLADVVRAAQNDRPNMGIIRQRPKSLDLLFPADQIYIRPEEFVTPMRPVRLLPCLECQGRKVRGAKVRMVVQECCQFCCPHHFNADFGGAGISLQNGCLKCRCLVVLQINVGKDAVMIGMSTVISLGHLCNGPPERGLQVGEDPSSILSDEIAFLVLEHIPARAYDGGGQRTVIIGKVERPFCIYAVIPCIYALSQ